MNSEQDSIDMKIKIFMKIQENKQIIVLNMLWDCKYAMILRLSWLRNINSWINWATEEICSADKAYDVVKQSKMCLSEHQAWDYEISLILKKKSVWKSLYDMSEDQLKTVKKYLDENLKQEFIKSFKSSTEYSILFVLKKNDQKQLCIDY